MPPQATSENEALRVPRKHTKPTPAPEDAQSLLADLANTSYQPYMTMFFVKVPACWVGLKANQKEGISCGPPYFGTNQYISATPATCVTDCGSSEMKPLLAKQVQSQKKLGEEKGEVY